MSRPKRILDILAGFQIGKAARQVKRDLSLPQCNRPKRDEEFVDGFDVPDTERASYRLVDGFGEPVETDFELTAAANQQATIEVNVNAGNFIKAVVR